MNNTVSIRKFNEKGITAFEQAISQLRIGETNVIDENLLFHEDLSETFEPVINISKGSFKTKKELVQYLCESLNLKSNRELYYDSELWTWLSAYFFDTLCPADSNGKRKVKENAFYILQDPKHYNKFYRHLLAHFCRLYNELGESSKIFLIGDFSKRGEMTEQFGAYQEICLNKGIIDMANIYYWDGQKNALKRGASGKSGGSARRLMRIIRQYQLTYDINSMNSEMLIKIMPLEFKKWID